MDVNAAAELLLGTWREPTRLLDSLPESMRPGDAAAAYALQGAVMAGLGPIGGWKVGASGPDAPCTCAPMPHSGIQPSPASVPGARHTLRGIESEIAFRMGRDLPPRQAPYARAEVMDAIASCHPAIELVESRFVDDTTLDAPTRLADFLSHGGFVFGPAIAGWQSLDFAGLTVEQEVDGAPDRQGTGNPAGDMIRLVAFLADEGAVWAGGLRAGQFVTCGSWTGKSFVPAGSRVRVRFAGAAVVEAAFVP